MPGGPSVVGFVAFTGVKFGGYVVAAVALKKAFRSDSSPWKVGLARTLIGLGVGVTFGLTYAFLMESLAHRWSDSLSAVAFFGPLIPIRLAEWALLIHIFFDRGLVQRAKDLKYASIGAAWSFLLDAAGVAAALVIPGGIWVC